MSDEVPRLLDAEEYVEQAYLFRTLAARMQQWQSTQEVLALLREEILSTTRLPLAVDFLVGELKLHGAMAPAMTRLAHYFTPFQSFIMGEAEREGGRFDLRVALEVLEREADYRARGATPQGSFLFQFETLCRNRLGYDKGLEAIAADPIYNRNWAEWIATVRRQIGLVDLADLIYVRSEHYLTQRRRQGLPPDDPPRPVLFGEKEGQIALAHRRKEPLWLFATLERQLGYPVVPRPKLPDTQATQLIELRARLDRLESRLRLVEEESRGGIDLAKFYAKPVPLQDEPPAS